ncbi:hypothetical protein B0H12DRAFT_1245541 [Mycena haematopus]|nr:hypothetical protein B0H12DRAFT_1245541 [Mycena haematopus]
MLITVSSPVNHCDNLIKVLFPNDCCDREILRLYNKDLLLGPERIQVAKTLGAYASSGYVNPNDLHDSIRLRIRNRPLNNSPVDFETYRSPDSDVSDDESGGETNKNTVIPAYAGDYPASLAVIPTFSEKDASLALASIFPDLTVQILYRELNLGITGRTPARNHILSEIVFDTPIFYVRPAYHELLLKSICKIADFIHCAGNDHNPYSDGPPSAKLRIEALRENNTPLPGISLFQGYEMPEGEELNNRNFLSAVETESYIIDLEQILNYYTHWLIDCGQNSLSHGINSCWNFGAPIGMPKTEFLHRVAPGFMYGGGNPSVHRLLSNPVLANEMDFRNYLILIDK